MKKNPPKTEYITRADLEEQTQIILEAMDRRFDKMQSSLKADITDVRTLIDGYVKAQEDFRQEFVIMKEEFKQIKKILKEKFNLEIKSV